MNALISGMVTSFHVLKSDFRVGGMTLRVCRAYSLVLVIMYCNTEVVRNSCKYSMGDALRGSPMVTPGDAENANDEGGRGSESMVVQ